MFEPVIDHERVVFIEVAVIEYQKKLAAVRPESLDRVRRPGREKPKITSTHVIDKISAVGIDCGDPGSSMEHVGPLGSFMPMHVAGPAGIQAHVNTCKCRCDAELTTRHLARPATCLKAHMSIGE